MTPFGDVTPVVTSIVSVSTALALVAYSVSFIRGRWWG